MRGFGGFSNFAISFSIISILTGAVTLFDYGLTMGGPLEMTLGWPIVTGGTLLVALSMAELCSALPTSGGMYHWSAELGGPMWAWFTAWLNIVGLIACIAGIDYGCALFLVPLLGIESKPSTLIIVYGLLLLSQAVINHYSTRWIAWLNDLSVTVHIVGVAVLIGALWLFAPKRPVSFLIQATTSSHIHGSYIWLFMLGLLQAQWTFTGFDASAHVAEETVDPRRRAPWGMVMSVIVSGFFGYLLVLSLTWAIPNIGRVLGAKDAGGNPIPAVLAIVEMTLGSRAGVVVLGLTVIAMWFCGLAACTSVSRTFYAFARDNGMPLSKLWSRINPRRKTPVLAIWLSVALAFAAMVYSGAYSVVTSIS
ncbi:MAG: amino acid permease, partial [Terriglobia bacterium]